MTTDTPRFSQIIVEDNGHGMSAAIVAHLLLHIGGSAKRSEEGQALGVTANDNPLLSPGGRRLIGKIGIGLFSVSQLTQTFQIITKTQGERFRTVATVILRQFSDEFAAKAKDSPIEKFESGKVNIWREPAADIETHGTSIVLTNLRPQARDTLRSRELWAAIENAEAHPDPNTKEEIVPPTFHIGRIDPTSGELLKKTSNRFDHLPWSPSDDSARAFRSMVDSVWNFAASGNTNAQLEQIFDYCLRMVWQLGLAIPLPYVSGHPFDLPLRENDPCYLISNIKGTGAATRLEVNADQTLRGLLDLVDPVENQGSFKVFFDGVELARPLKFTGLPVTKHALRTPLIFVGKCREEFTGIAPELSGGPIDFEAYLLWAPKIAPTEHQGSLIRIHGSSGTLFDSTFMRYGVSEQTRLRQITCEIFIHQGLDSALNIDRESFNNAHPHSVYITRWLHNALRQVATVQKRLGREVRSEEKFADQANMSAELNKLALRIWQQNAEDEGSYPPEVIFTDGEAPATDSADTFVFSREVVMDGTNFPNTENSRIQKALLEDRMKVLAQVLAAFGLLESLSSTQQERLLRTLQQIITSKNE